MDRDANDLVRARLGAGTAALHARLVDLLDMSEEPRASELRTMIRRTVCGDYHPVRSTFPDPRHEIEGDAVAVLGQDAELVGDIRAGAFDAVETAAEALPAPRSRLRLTDGQDCVLRVLEEFAARHGENPSAERIGELMGLGTIHVMTILRDLCRRGLAIYVGGARPYAAARRRA